MRQFWRGKRRQQQAEAVDADKPKSKLAGARPMHVDPDDDRPTREDVEEEKKSRRTGSGIGPQLGV